MIKFSSDEQSNLDILNNLPEVEAIYNFTIPGFNYIGQTNSLRRRMNEHLIQGSNVAKLKEIYEKDPSSMIIQYTYFPGSSFYDRIHLEQALKDTYDFDKLLNRDPFLEDYTTRKEVFQLTMEGDFLASYHSTWEVQRKLGFNQQEISKACRKDVYRYNYLWMYQKEYSPKSAKEKADRCVAYRVADGTIIHAFLQDGEYLASFNGCQHADSLTGIYQQNITKCLKGKRKSAGKVNGQKVIWLYDHHLKQKPKINLAKEGSILQIETKYRKVVDRFSSVIEASNSTGIHPGNISKVLNNNRNTAGGYYWKKDDSYPIEFDD